MESSVWEDRCLEATGGFWHISWNDIETLSNLGPFPVNSSVPSTDFHFLEVSHFEAGAFISRIGSLWKINGGRLQSGILKEWGFVL